MAASSIDFILRPRAVAETLGVSRNTIWRMVQRGDLPHPLKISTGVVGWRRSEIDAFLDRKAGGAA